MSQPQTEAEAKEHILALTYGIIKREDAVSRLAEVGRHEART